MSSIELVDPELRDALALSPQVPLTAETLTRRRADALALASSVPKPDLPDIATGEIHVERVLVQIDWQTRLADMAVRRCRLYGAASTAFQTAGALRSLRNSLSRLNCPLWIRRNSSMPAIVIAAVLNHLNPSIGSMRSFTPR